MSTAHTYKYKCPNCGEIEVKTGMRPDPKIKCPDCNDSYECALMSEIEPLPKVYLAGPEVFLSNAKAYFEQMKKLCETHQFEPLVPLDNEVPSWKTGVHAAGAIFDGNVAMIKKADFLIANISPFRSPSCDPGTAWEIGAAYALGIPVFAYSKTHVEYKERLDNRKDYGIVEDFGLTDNLMIACAVQQPIYHTFTEALLAVALAKAKTGTLPKRS